jgi:hypothetical protein
MAEDEAISLKRGRICYEAKKVIPTVDLLTKTLSATMEPGVLRPNLKEMLTVEGKQISN